MPSFILRDTTTFFHELLGCEVPINLTAPSSVVTPLMLMLSGLPVAHPLPFPDLEEAVMQLKMWGSVGPLMVLKGSLPAYVTLSAKRDTSLVIQLYGLAMRMGWHAEAEFMASHALELDVWEEKYAPDLAKLGSNALVRLIRVRRERRDQLVANLRRLSNLPFSESHGCRSPEAEALMDKLQLRIFWEMDKHPSGHPLIRALTMDDWPEAIACWKLQCSECEKALYEKVAYVKEVRMELDKLSGL